MTRQYGLLAGVCCVSDVWEAKSLSVLVFLPSLYLCSVACRLGPGRVVPVQGHYSSAWPCMEGIPAYRTQPTESEAWLAGWALWSPQTLLLSYYPGKASGDRWSSSAGPCQEWAHTRATPELSTKNNTQAAEVC